MKINKLGMILMTVFLISILSLGVFALKGNSNMRGPNFDEEVHAQLDAALAAGDYDLWVSIRHENNLPMKGKIFSVITAENFDMYVQLHNANRAGDVESVNEIRSALGLGQGMLKKGVNKQSWQESRKGSNFGGNFLDVNGDSVCDNY